jgi:hypothetical protein
LARISQQWNVFATDLGSAYARRRQPRYAFGTMNAQIER